MYLKTVSIDTAVVKLILDLCILKNLVFCELKQVVYVPFILLVLKTSDHILLSFKHVEINLGYNWYNN